MVAVRQRRQLSLLQRLRCREWKQIIGRLINMLCLRCRMIYNMCTQKPPHDYSEQLYSRYRDAFNIYINETVRR